MISLLLAFVAGACGFHLLNFLPQPGWLFLAMILPGIWFFPTLRRIAALLAGFFWSFAFAYFQLNPALPGALEGKDLILTGVIGSIPTQRGEISRFELQVRSLEAQAAADYPLKKVRLTWRHPSANLEPGQLWRLQVRLKRPWGFQNPGGFDYERWLFTHGIQAIGYVRKAESNKRLDAKVHGQRLTRLRYRFARKIDQASDNSRAAALIKALAIGDRSGLSTTEWESFARTGTNHLVAISGLHIGMVAGLVYFLTQWLWRRSERLTLLLPAMRAGAWMALLAAACYAALAGFSLPTQRALAMLLLALGSVLLGRSLSVSRSLSLALFGVILIDPLAPLSAGFWLSFGAVGIILFGLRGRLRHASTWGQWGRVQWLVALGLAPLLFFLFGRASLIAPLVNLLLVPWFSFALVPLVLLSLPLLQIPNLGAYWFTVTENAASATMSLLDWASGTPFASLQLEDKPVWVWICCMLGLLLILLPRGMPGRQLGWLLLLPVWLNGPAKLEEGELLLTLLDVGQGLSCVIETSEHALVYDTGPQFPSGFNTAEAVLLPYLRSRGINGLDLLVLSNLDRDHAGGYEALQKSLPMQRVVSGEADAESGLQPCEAGDSWRWNGVEFSFLHPAADDRFSKSNNASCVLKVESKGGSILLPGDIERKAEQLLVERYGKQLRAEILIGPHHGSKTSSTQKFVSQVAPDLVLFATGYRNPYGFPKPEIVNRWSEIGAQTLTTASSGAIQIKLSAQDLLTTPRLHRVEERRYWLSSSFIAD